MVFAAVIAALVTVVSSWVFWHIYQVYLQSLQLSPIPGPPAAPGRLNAVLGNLSDLSDNQYHRTTTRWSEKYGGVCRLRFLDKHVGCTHMLHTCPSLSRLSCAVSDMPHCYRPFSLQVVLIADPVIACEMLKDKSMDKSTRAYATMNAVSHISSCRPFSLRLLRYHDVWGSVQLFDDKGHSGLLTSQMTPRWRAVRKAVASALSPQTLRCDAETKTQENLHS